MALQNLEVNLASLSLIMQAGIPWSLTISFTKSWAISKADAVVQVGIRWATLVNLSTTTKIESKFPDTLGILVMKSKLMHSHFIWGTSKGWSFQGILTHFALTFWQMRRCLVNFKASFFILGQKKFCFKEENNLWYLGWATKGDSWASFRICF